MSDKAAVTILGIFVADVSFRAKRLPVLGETILGDQFFLGPGGKGSNQSVAVARCGGQAQLITKIGRDQFGDMAMALWGKDGVDTGYVARVSDHATGSAFIFISSETGDNAIIVASGAAGTLSVADVEASHTAITSARVFMTQLETAMPVSKRGLELARQAGCTTIFNPAPAAEIDPIMFQLTDWMTPNETEVEHITGVKVESLEDAQAAATRLLERGVQGVVITLGANGVWLQDKSTAHHIPSFKVKVVETTGAGDAFNGGFATALAEGRAPLEAARFGVATAALSVTKSGAAASMPARPEIDALLGRPGLV